MVDSPPGYWYCWIRIQVGVLGGRIEWSGRAGQVTSCAGRGLVSPRVGAVSVSGDDETPVQIAGNGIDLSAWPYTSPAA
jgi:hypothetical protein